MFDWDEEKAQTNKRKHGVSFGDAVAVFYDPRAYTFPDPDHSRDEERELTVGKIGAEVVLTVSHTGRDGKTRIISARRATFRERKRYEQF